MKLQLLLLSLAVWQHGSVVNAVDWFGRSSSQPAKERNTELAYGYEVAGSDTETAAAPCAGEGGNCKNKDCCDGLTCGADEKCAQGGGGTCYGGSNDPCSLNTDGEPITTGNCCASGFACEPDPDADWENSPVAGTCQKSTGSDRVTFCHKTGSNGNPWVRLTTSKAGWENGHNQPSHQNGQDFLIIDWKGEITPDELKRYYEPACPTPKQNSGKCCHKGGTEIPGHGTIYDCCAERPDPTPATPNPTDPREDTPNPTTPNPTDPPKTPNPTDPPTSKPTNLPTTPPTPPPTEPSPEECVELEKTKFEACNPIIPLGSDTKDYPPNNLIFHNLKVLDDGNGLEFSVENPYKSNGEDADIWVEYLRLNEKGEKENYCDGETKPCETNTNREDHKRYQASCIVASNVPVPDQKPYTGVNVIVRAKVDELKGGAKAEDDIPCCCKRHGDEDRGDDYNVTMFSYAIFCGCLPERDDFKLAGKSTNRDLSEGLEDVSDECDACPDIPPSAGAQCNFGTCSYNKCPESYVVATCTDAKVVEIEDLKASCPQEDIGTAPINDGASP